MDGRSEAAGRRDEPFGWYLRQRHELIRRHVESLTLHPDPTAAWELTIDLELPTEPEAALRRGRDGIWLFPFPLVFLKKADGRMKFTAHNETGAKVQIPIREECDKFSTQAATEAANALLAEIELDPASLPAGELKESLGRIVAEKPYQSSMVLLKLREQVGLVELDNEDGDGDENEAQPSELNAEVGRIWSEKGLDEVLQMLVEHSLIWVLLRGRPGERRTIVLSEEKILQRRTFVSWVFGELTVPKRRWLHPFATRRANKAKREMTASEAAGKQRDPAGAMAIGNKPYGRRKRRISFSTLGERVGQPLAWMPFEFEFPTIYAMRCTSYHFELRCPPGRSPRDLRVAGGSAMAEPRKRKGIAEKKLPEGTRKTLTSSVARLDIPPLPSSEKGTDTLDSDVWFRITVGIGDGAFPILWFLATAITAAMLWVLADTDPSLGEADAQIVAGILLVVPALAAALALGSNEVPVSQLIGGARILLLVSGLSAVGATAVVAGARPFGISAESAWAICAMAATAATVPLGTSWLLSSPVVWFRLRTLDSRKRQKAVLAVGVGLALAAVFALIVFCDDPISRGILAVYLLALPVATSVIANDRVAMKVDVTRHYIAVSFLSAGFVCLVLACIELRGAIDEETGLQTGAEWAAVALLLGSLLVGDAVNLLTGRFRPKEDEVHVSPSDGRAMLAREKVRELATLRERENLFRKKQEKLSKDSNRGP
jgi:hypothetical protein